MTTDALADSKYPALPSLPPTSEQPTHVIAGRYEVVQTLSGGMALVHLCRDHQTGQLVALKTFKPKYLSHREARDLFLREGTMWVDIGRHPHIVRAYRVERLGDGLEVYLVLEWVVQPQGIDKPSLRAWLRPGRPLPLKQALLFALHIARGMKYATKKIPGLVHRDLKPENVLIGYDGQARVTDFGLASTLAILGDAAFSDVSSQKEAHLRTQLTQGAAGTPLYMSPEQWLRQPLDARADIYALGCIVYEMVSGRFAAFAESREAIRDIHLNGRIKPPPASLPREVLQFLRKCMMTERTQRFRDWAEVEQELEELFRRVLEMEPPAEHVTETETRAEKLSAGHSYNTMGLSYLDLGKLSVAIMYFEQAVWIGRTEQSLALEGAGLGNLGRAYRALGYTDRAIEFHKEHLAIARQIGDRAQEGRALGDLGEAYRQLGNDERAIRYHQEELKIARELGDVFKEAAALDSLGNTYWGRGDVTRAVEFYKQSLALARQVEDRARMKSILSSMGHVYLRSGETKEAVALFYQALSLARRIGDRMGEGEALGDLGYLYQTLGHEEKAADYYKQALAIALESDDRRREAINRTRLADMLVARGPEYLPEAQQEYALALTAVEDIGDNLQIITILAKQAHTDHLLGDYMSAASLYKRVLQMAEQTQNRAVQSEALLALARAYEAWGDTSRALQYYRDFCKMAADGSVPWQVESEVFPAMSSLYLKLRQLQPALEAGEKYLARAIEQKDSHAMLDAYYHLGEVYSRTTDKKRAADYFKKALALAREVQNPTVEVLALSNLALVLQYMEGVGSGWRAGRYIDKALARANETRDARLVAEAHYKLALLLLRQKKWERAGEVVQLAIQRARALQDGALLERAERLEALIAERSQRSTGFLS